MDEKVQEKMALTTAVQSSTPSILVLGADFVALELLQAQIELRGLQGCVEIVVSAAVTPVALDTEAADLVIWHGPIAEILPACFSKGIPVILIGELNAAELRDEDQTLPSSYTVMELIDAVGRVVEFPWPTEIFDELRSETKLSETERRYRDLFNRGGDAVLLIEEKTHTIIAANKQAERLYGYASSELVGQYMLVIADPSNHVAIYKSASSLDSTSGSNSVAARRIHVKKDGTPMTVAVSGTLLAYGKFNIFQDILRDETERVCREEQLKKLVDERTLDLMHEQELLRHAQKMEALGQFTGGITHDFNNLLSIIIGNNELLNDHLRDDKEGLRLVQRSTAAAERGAQLTSQLLAFARQQPLEPECLDLASLVPDMRDMLRLVLDKSIELTFFCARHVRTVKVDKTLLQNAILNLALNARDAMASGGILAIEMGNVVINVEAARLFGDVEPGQYGYISVADTGEGMPPEVKEHIFEPFYTTKDVGKGTGLGLSMVHGFVTQSGGHVTVDSAPGHGTTFTLYFPDAGDLSHAPVPLQELVCEGTKKVETILVVDDEEKVRNIALARLRKLGYRTLEAENAHAALGILAATTDVDLVLTDLAMPGGISGVDLAKILRRDFPGTKVILSSGFAEGQALQGDRAIWLHKPYQIAELATVVRRVLDGQEG